MTTQAEGGAPAPSTLRDLLERVENATGPDRELDLAIRKQFGVVVPLNVMPNDREWYGPEIFGGMNSNTRYVPLYTTSLDAATALMDRLLPGWSRRIETPHFAPPVYQDHGFQGLVRDVERARAAKKELSLPHDLCEREQRGLYAVTLYQGGGASEPLALLAAVLKALIAQQETP